MSGIATTAQKREDWGLRQYCRLGRIPQGRELERSGGEGGIRTPDTLSGMSAFEADRFNHSRTSPRRATTLPAASSRQWLFGREPIRFLELKVSLLAKKLLQHFRALGGQHS